MVNSTITANNPNHCRAQSSCGSLEREGRVGLEIAELTNNEIHGAAPPVAGTFRLADRQKQQEQVLAENRAPYPANPH